MRLNGLVKQRRIVTNLLRQTGFACVAEAEDGVEALRKLEIGDYQFIVSDWNMPKMNGLELLKTVRLSPKLKHTPFLLVTAEAHKENIVEAAQAGADGYIAKPYSASTWSEKIESNLQRKATARIRHSCPSRLCTDNTFEQLGRITRQLHEAITALGLEQSLHTSTQEIPDVRDRLCRAGKMTDAAADEVLNLIDRAQPQCQDVKTQSQSMRDAIGKLRRSASPCPAEVADVLATCQMFGSEAIGFSDAQNAVLGGIMMTQDFQDLSGQIIKKVIDIISLSEQQLLTRLRHRAPERIGSMTEDDAGGAPRARQSAQARRCRRFAGFARILKTH